MSVKRVGLTALMVFAVMTIATATATAMTVTIAKSSYFKTNTTFLWGENVIITISETAPYIYNVSVYNSAGKLVWYDNSTVSGTVGYTSNTVVTWPTSTVSPGIYTVKVWTNRSGSVFSTTLTLCGINYVKIEGVPMSGVVKAYDKAKIEVGITTTDSQSTVNVIFPFNDIGKVSLVGTVNTTTKSGVYTGVVNLSKATYQSESFYVNVSFGNNVYVNDTYWINVEPNATAKWIVVEADTNKPSGWNIDSADCAVLKFGQNVINATIYVAVADQYGNAIPGSLLTRAYNATIYKISGPTVNINKTTVTIDSTHPYQAVKISVLASDAPCTVTIGINNGPNTKLETTTKSIYYTTGIDHLKVVVEKQKLYANNTDSTKVYVFLKDKSDKTLKIGGINITLSEKTNLGLGGLGTVKTNASGIATFTVVAGSKSGVATIVAVTGDGSAYGTANITLLQAVNPVNSKFANSQVTMTAGKPVKIVYELRDYSNEPIKNAKVKFNITSGDGWFELNGKKVESPCIVTTDSNGNATIYVNSTNATNGNHIVIEVYYINESGKWERDSNSICIVSVRPAPVYRVAVFHGTEEVKVGYAFPEGYNKQITFTVKYLDKFGNVNTSSGTVKIIPQKGVVGSFSSATVSLTGGSGTITFTPNASAKVGQYTDFVFNDTTFKVGNTTIRIAVSGVENIELTFNKPGYYVNDTVKVYAQLIGMYNTKLAKSGVNVTFTVKGPDYFKVGTNVTDDNGVAVFSFKPVKPGVYTVTAANGTIYSTNKTVVAGKQIRVVIEPKSRTVSVNTTVTFNITAYDVNGYPSSYPNSTVYITVLKNGILPVNRSTVSLTAGKATWRYNFTEIGRYTVIAQLNATMYDTANITVTPPAMANITLMSVVVPQKVYVNTTATIEVSVKNVGNAAGNATVELAVIMPNNTTRTYNITFENVKPNAIMIKSVEIPVTMAGTYTVKVGTITKTFSAIKIVQPWQKYDKNHDNKIEDTELLNAITDWLKNKINDQTLLDIIMKWLE